MTAKQERRARKKARRSQVLCDGCGKLWPFHKVTGSSVDDSGSVHITACPNCQSETGVSA